MPSSPTPSRSILSALRLALGRVHRFLLTWKAGLGDDQLAQQEGFSMLAPARLRDRVHGSPDARGFLGSGRRAFNVIREAVAEQGQPLERCSPILDFGCGCGRTLRWFQWYRRLELYGTDIDADAIAWCQEHVPIGRFEVNDAMPPLSYPDNTFQLVYGISVLTHLDEAFQDAWLAELQRVTRPGGLVLLTVHGRGSYVALQPHERANVEGDGFIYTRSTRWDGVFPDWYQNAFHHPDYVREHFDEYFEVLDINEGILGGIQDMVVMRKRT